jgi:hypothetical protein
MYSAPKEKNFRMHPIHDWAVLYLNRGFAIARIKPGEKRPREKGWNLQSFDPDALREVDNVGIQAGRLSGDLVCVDLDSRHALALADQYLPPTGMVEGRPGKPRSHRWYRVENIPSPLIAERDVASGMGGPRIRHFNGPDGKRLIDFLGTGRQAVVPPSLWVSEDKTHCERREWDVFEEPAVLDCQELFDAVCRLASACGWTPKEEPSATKTFSPAEPLPRLAIPSGEAARQARSYIATIPGAVQGEGGDHRTFTVACTLVIDFGLDPETALPLLLEYNERCSPPWSLAELKHKLAAADILPNRVRGLKLRKTQRKIDVHIRPGDDMVFVGVDCAKENHSYVNLSSMGAAIVKVGTRRELAADLSSIDWIGKHVLLTPPSTITTNQREVWIEHFLANQLRTKGAEVKSLHIPPRNGRKQTFVTAEGQGEIIDPPFYASDARALANIAGQRARDLDSYRKSLPRNTPSPKLLKAIRFVTENDIRKLSKENIQRAKKRKISQSTLLRAIREYSENTSRL